MHACMGRWARAWFIATTVLLAASAPAVAAGNDAAAATPEPGYAGSEACMTCHQDRYQQFKQTTMGKILLLTPKTALQAKGCEACHGPAQAHVDAGGGRGQFIIAFGKDSKQPAQVQNAQCLQCHEKGMRIFWKGSPHESRGLTCVSCHQVMEQHGTTSRFLEPLSENRQFVKPTQAELCFQCHQMRRAQLHRSSHMPFREGKVTCTSCHNPHGTANPKQLIESTVNENCYKCHAERRGPFLWEHPPVSENCLNCHEAHGSTNPQLLKTRTPRLCQRCHDESRHPTTPQLAATRFVFNRSCTNCHSQIHGSNHPSGPRFQR